MISFKIELLIILMCVVVCDTVTGVACYTCTSINGSDPTCRDPFNPTGGHYDRKCMQGRDGRVGLFPAKYCIKIKGIRVGDGMEMIVRSCGMESMDNTCGPFVFKGHQYYGCLMSCRKPACNSSTSTVSFHLLHALLTFITWCIANR